MRQWTMHTILLGLSSAACMEHDVIGEDVERRLLVQADGLGTGDFVFEPPGEPCSIEGGRCATYHQEIDVTVRAQPDAASSTFVGWSPICGSVAECRVNMRDTVSITGTFGVKSYGLTLCREGSGTGHIESTAGIDTCDAESCLSEHPFGTFVALTAVPANGSTFAGWTGSCAGESAGTCLVEIKGDTSVCAQFDDQRLDVRTGSVATLLSFPARTPLTCWFSGMDRAVRQTATEVIIATNTHHACDTQIDLLSVHVAPLGSSEFVTTTIDRIDYVGQHSQGAEWGRGIPNNITAAIDQGGRPHVLAPVRLGSDGDQPQRFLHAIRVDGRWEIERDVVNVGTFVSLHGNRSGAALATLFGAVLDAHPTTGHLSLLGHPDTQFERTYRVASATYADGVWGELDSIYSSSTTMWDRSTIADTDQAFDTDGRGAQVWIDKPMCTVVTRTFLPGQGWGAQEQHPLRSRWCTGDPDGRFGFSGEVHAAPVRGGFDVLVQLQGQQTAAPGTYYRMSWRGSQWSLGEERPATWAVDPEGSMRTTTIGGELHAAYIAASRNSIVLERMDDGSIAELFTNTLAAIERIDIDRVEPRAIVWVTRDRVTGETLLQARPILIEGD